MNFNLILISVDVKLPNLKACEDIAQQSCANLQTFVRDGGSGAGGGGGELSTFVPGPHQTNVRKTLGP